MSRAAMSATQQNSRAVVLVKALPQPSKTYGETVCCAGVTAEGQWKRLFPVRFRHLRGDSSFSRWDFGFSSTTLRAVTTIKTGIGKRTQRSGDGEGVTEKQVR